MKPLPQLLLMSLALLVVGCAEHAAHQSSVEAHAEYYLHS